MLLPGGCDSAHLRQAAWAGLQNSEIHKASVGEGHHRTYWHLECLALPWSVLVQFCVHEQRLFVEVRLPGGIGF